MGNTNICGDVNKDWGNFSTFQNVLKKKFNLKNSKEDDSKIEKAKSIQRSWSSKKKFDLKNDLAKNIEDLGEKINHQDLKGMTPAWVLEEQTNNPLNYEEDLSKKNLQKNLIVLEPIRLKNGDIYHGQWSKHKKPEGIGYLVKPNGGVNILEGIWKDGDLVKGRIYYVDQTYYQGEVANENPNGEGTLVEDYATFCGQWVNGNKHGGGKINFKDGTRFEGNFENNNVVNGKFYWPNGSHFEGEVANFTLGPNGAFATNNGDVYTGGWLFNKPNGKGTFTWRENNCKYEGEYLKGKKEGQGVYFFNCQDVFYKGSWLYDRPHGHGEFHTEDRIVIGLWRYGKLVQIYSEARKKEDDACKEKEVLFPSILSQNINTCSLPHLKHERNNAAGVIGLIFKPKNAEKEDFSMIVKPGENINNNVNVILTDSRTFENIEKKKDMLISNIKIEDKEEQIIDVNANYNQVIDNAKVSNYSQLHIVDDMRNNIESSNVLDNENIIIDKNNVQHDDDIKVDKIIT